MYSNLHGWLLFVVVEWKFLDKLYQEASLERLEQQFYWVVILFHMLKD